MQPTIIKLEKLYITGLTGDGAQTLNFWTDFDNQYKVNPFPKANETGYEIRFCESRRTGKTPEQSKNVHVGFLAEKALKNSDYATVELPASEYVVFEVYVAKGYDSGNDEMEKWLTENKPAFGMREFDGFEYVIEVYNEKFKNGDQPDSVVEFWIPLFRYCQCCAMPLTKPEDFGTEADGSPNMDYCHYCYENGSFGEEKTMEEVIKICIPFCLEAGEYPNAETARSAMMAFFPKLKRWAK